MLYGYNYAISQLIAIIVCIVNVSCWNLDITGVSEDTIQITKIAISGSKAFLCIPRVDKNQSATLVEVPWPETVIQTTNTRVFPSIESQILDSCDSLQSAVALDIDSRGRLYVLDAGLDFCSAKVIIYDIRTSRELMKIDLSGVSVNNLASLVVDQTSPTEPRVFIGGAGRSSLIEVNPREESWWEVHLSSDFSLGNGIVMDTPIGTSNLAISKKESVMYIASPESSKLFSLDMNAVRNIDEPLKIYCNSLENNGTTVSMDCEGELFGKSPCIFVDQIGGLVYYYEKFFVLLKWNTKYRLTAESTEVLMQNDLSLSSVVQIFSDGYHQLWALNSMPNVYGVHTVKIKNV